MAALGGDLEAEPVRYEKDGEPVPKGTEGAERVETYWTTETSQFVYERMGPGTILQSMLRVGRSTDERTRVWVETSAIYDFVPRVLHQVRRLTNSEVDMLTELSDGPMQVKEIAEAIDVSKQTIYYNVDRLTKLALVAPAGTEKYEAQIYEMQIDEVPEVVIDRLNHLYIDTYIHSLNSIREHDPGPDDYPDWIVGSEGESVSERVYGRPDITKVGVSVAVQETFDVVSDRSEAIPLAENNPPPSKQTTFGD